MGLELLNINQLKWQSLSRNSSKIDLIEFIPNKIIIHLKLILG